MSCLQQNTKASQIERESRCVCGCSSLKRKSSLALPALHNSFYSRTGILPAAKNTESGAGRHARCLSVQVIKSIITKPDKNHPNNAGTRRWTQPWQIKMETELVPTEEGEISLHKCVQLKVSHIKEINACAAFKVTNHNLDTDDCITHTPTPITSPKGLRDQYRVWRIDRGSTINIYRVQKIKRHGKKKK